MRGTSLLVALLLLTACTGAPTFNTLNVDPLLTPQRVTANPQLATGKSVQWGGTIVGITNLRDSTQVEVLDYPLDSDGRPKSDGAAQGRFIFEHAGYLEPASYAAGKQVTVVGNVTGTRDGRVGEANYVYPVVDATQLHLWNPERSRFGGGTSTFFNFGVGGGSGGNWGSGVGVGVGF
jgi:outer membrane lipoprotein